MGQSFYRTLYANYCYINLSLPFPRLPRYFHRAKNSIFMRQVWTIVWKLIFQASSASPRKTDKKILLRIDFTITILIAFIKFYEKVGFMKKKNCIGNAYQMSTTSH